jgi:signal transduction histidine kinase
VALALRISGEPFLDHAAPFQLFTLAIAFAAWYGGLGPGILTTILGAIAATALFLPLVTAKGTPDHTHILHTSLYIVTGVFISVLMRKLHNILEQSSMAGRELESRVQERTVELAEAIRELQVEKSKFLGILDQMPEAVLIVNPQYQIEYANPAMEREFGPIAGLKCYEHLSGPGSTVCTNCLIPEVMKGKSFLQEYASPKTHKVYDCFEAPITFQKGSQCKLKILHDITGLKAAEEELLSKHQEIERLSSELLTAQETERMRISRELHDELGQSLTLVKLKIGMIDMDLPESQSELKTHCRDASVQVDQAIENMRRLSRDLSPVTVETLGITIALQRLAESFDKTGKIRVTADIDNVDNLLLTQFNILLYRIIQEGLNNVVKHSGATAAAIALKKNENAIHVELQDNGKGIDAEKTSWREKAKSQGLGLTIMRERVRTLGGALIIQGRKDAGTRLHFVIPLRNKEIGDGELPDNTGR